MRTSIGEKCVALAERDSGYLRTSELLEEGISNRQIARLIEDGILERVCHGVYWFQYGNRQKPREYKAVEISKSNPNAVVCADSACFYQGLIEVEPFAFSVATRRGDRRKLQMNFPVIRHYYAESCFLEAQKVLHTDFGDYCIYDIDRSVCDCIRFRETIGEDMFCLIIECYKKQRLMADSNLTNRLWKYAEKLRMMNQVKKYLS